MRYLLRNSKKIFSTFAAFSSVKYESILLASYCLPQVFLLFLLNCGSESLIGKDMNECVLCTFRRENKQSRVRVSADAPTKAAIASESLIRASNCHLICNSTSWSCITSTKSNIIKKPFHKNKNLRLNFRSY